MQNHNQIGTVSRSNWNLCCTVNWNCCSYRALNIFCNQFLRSSNEKTIPSNSSPEDITYGELYDHSLHVTPVILPLRIVAGIKENERFQFESEKKQFEVEKKDMAQKKDEVNASQRQTFELLRPSRRTFEQERVRS
eukprot:TRINITY_DN1130_c1_g1_i5.p1 TRINITY_DN1130_c1_g1~~TRINITY_DN1130_c1_g1_i5.p1  ORF type:complete len:136 (+),score=27.19 TRINITY_DN1130_c1_g1_i5:827-1234(+)